MIAEKLQLYWVSCFYSTSWSNLKICTMVHQHQMVLELNLLAHFLLRNSGKSALIRKYFNHHWWNVSAYRPSERLWRSQLPLEGVLKSNLSSFHQEAAFAKSMQLFHPGIFYPGQRRDIEWISLLYSNVQKTSLTWAPLLTPISITVDGAWGLPMGSVELCLSQLCAFIHKGHILATVSSAVSSATLSTYFLSLRNG